MLKYNFKIASLNINSTTLVAILIIFFKLHAFLCNEGYNICHSNRFPDLVKLIFFFISEGKLLSTHATNHNRQYRVSFMIIFNSILSTHFHSQENHSEFKLEFLCGLFVIKFYFFSENFRSKLFFYGSRCYFWIVWNLIRLLFKVIYWFNLQLKYWFNLVVVFSMYKFNNFWNTR